MSERAVITMSVDEFFGWQQGQQERYELVDGVPLKLISGASNFHDSIVVNIIARLHAQLRGTPCRVATADSAIRTKIKSMRRADAVVTCEEQRLDSYEAEKPRLVVEVLSPANSGVVWQRKLEEYRRREGLAYILLVDSRVVSATLLTRGRTEWQSTDYDRLDDAIELSEIGCRLELASVYEGLDLPQGSIES